MGDLYALGLIRSSLISEQETSGEFQIPAVQRGCESTGEGSRGEPGQLNV